MPAVRTGEQHRIVTILAGGPTPEYVSSITTALGILAHRDSLKDHFSFIPCLISKTGVWLDETTSERALAVYQKGDDDALQRMEEVVCAGTSVPPWLVVSSSTVVFPTIGGALGEDGVIIGLCRALATPFVGCDILTSVICLDKAVCKSVLQTAGLSQTPHIVVQPSDDLGLILESKHFSLPWVVKPADGGCSIGVSYVKSFGDFTVAIDKARGHYPDSNILVEPLVEHMLEIDVAVMEEISSTGDRRLVFSPPGLRQNFHLHLASSASSGVTASSAQGDKNAEGELSWLVPAPDLPEDVVKTMQALAKRAFRAVQATGFLRVDFFYVPTTGEILINEINTIPNTSIDSMWFKLWAAAGIEPKDWVIRVVEHALRRGDSQRLKLPLRNV
ncbi:hypothetical protein H2200_002978 [Cladophialophora chaetospira]|uniref:ATP-grasp domain-containing protein n=1 Tax=Cladophialophora chaetospira TaxID=386627 RepID=A0AA38XGK2_9EURO|nr:hypothetical protein H2200_002978 [Cladophialophora chaetospira]